MMPKSCIICRVEASLDVMLQYCDACQSAMYCSRACQRIDWKKQHKKICKLLNVGHGDMQVRTKDHTTRKIDLKERFEERERSLEEPMKRFFRLFQESTPEGSRAAAKNMKKIAKGLVKPNQMFLAFHGLHFLVCFSNPEMLSWPNSPLLVMLQFVGPNVLIGDEESRETLLHFLANMADTFDYLTHTNQLILAKQLIEHGANVNAVSIINGMTPLHNACYSGNVTNLDFVELLLEKGADPNAQEHMGKTPLMCTIPDAPGAAKFLLNWPTTDANMTTHSGKSFLATIRSIISGMSSNIANPNNLIQVQPEFLLHQWRGIEEMLVERGALDNGTSALEHL